MTCRYLNSLASSDVIWEPIYLDYVKPYDSIWNRFFGGRLKEWTWGSLSAMDRFKQEYSWREKEKLPKCPDITAVVVAPSLYRGMISVAVVQIVCLCLLGLADYYPSPVPMHA